MASSSREPASLVVGSRSAFGPDAASSRGDVTEAPQSFWIRIGHAANGGSIKPSCGCAFIPTVGVRRSLAAVQEAILTGSSKEA